MGRVSKLKYSKDLNRCTETSLLSVKSKRASLSQEYQTTRDYIVAI